MGLMGKKARRDAERRDAARRRDTLLRVLSLTVPLFTGWKYGLDAAKGKAEKQEDVANITKDVVAEVKALPVKERRYLSMAIANIERERLVLVQEMGIRGEIARRGSGFFQCLKDDLNDLSRELLDQNERYGLMTKLDDMAVLTYLVFAGLCDWGNNEVAAGRRPCKSFDNFLGHFRGLANHLIPENNLPLRQSMSNAYWNTRNELHGHPECWWDGGEDYWCPSGEEVRKAFNAATFAESAESTALTEAR